MTVEEIRSNIRYNENLIDEFNGEKRNLEKQIEELNALKEKYAGLQTKLDGRQQHRQTGLTRFLGSCLQNKILTRYYEGMNELLTGRDFSSAYNGLTEAKQKISRKIQEIDRQLDDCRERISYRRQRRDYWRGQLAAALAKEAE